MAHYSVNTALYQGKRQVKLPPEHHPLVIARRQEHSRAIRAVVIGHGRSPEGKRWQPYIDQSDLVLRMWDWTWQSVADLGERYDLGLIEVSDGDLARYWGHNKAEPRHGYIASYLRTSLWKLPPSTTVFSQHDAGWSAEAMKMGGIGETGKLEFTRGTLAAAWLMNTYLIPGDSLVLVGFDMVIAGATFDTDVAFSKSYQVNPGTFTFAGWKGGSTKHGNHDFAIEKPFLIRLAARFGISLGFAQSTWA